MSCSCETQAYAITLSEMLHVEHVMFFSFGIPSQHLMHSFMAQTADFVHLGMVEPDVPRCNAVRGGRAVKHQGPQAFHRQARVGPAATAHEILSEVPIVATQTAKPSRIRKITFKNKQT